MESNQELYHYGILGQKWGIRRYENPDGTLTEAGKKRYRYQNPDGSLTEEGKKDYMTAARKGKLNVHKLSNQDLDMINNRFNKEALYNKNVDAYKQSTFSYKLKKAVISRIKGHKGKKDNGGGVVAKLLAEPVKKAFEEAFKADNGGGKGSSGKDNENTRDNRKDKDNNPNNAPKNASNSNSSLSRLAGWTMSKTLDTLERDGYVSSGKKAVPKLFSRIDEIEKNGYSDIHKTWSNMNSSRLDDIEREGWTRHSGLYAISRSDELYHWGIKGQKWGVRRFENADGTLTEEGKARYSSSAAQRELSDTVKSSVRRYKGDSTNWYRSDKEDDRVYSVSAELKRHPVVRDAAKRVSSDLKNYRDAADAVHKEEKAFYSNEKVYEKYLNMAVNHFMKEVGPEWGTRENAYDWFKYDDGDQGNHSSIELYKRSPEGKKLVALEKTERDAYTNYVNACKKYVSDYTGEFGNEKVKYTNGFERTVNERLSDYVREIAENNKYYRA